jgi:xanthine dehydrogenase accessory factor
VFTHDHALDYGIVREILRREDFAFAGLIGSKSKAARFRAQLRRDGIGEDLIARLVCPIGVPGVTGKHPAIIAVAVAAQLLQTMSRPATSESMTADVCTPDRCATCANHPIDS